MEMSVVTLPRELAMKEEGVAFDGGVINQREAGQKKVLGNDLVKAFLERQNQGQDQKHHLQHWHRGQMRGGYLDRLEEVGSGAEDNNSYNINTAGDEMKKGIPGILSLAVALMKK